MKWRHKIRPIAKNFRMILIFFARDDAKLMPGEVCQVSCRYSNKWRSYSRKTEGGVGSDPPPGGGGLTFGRWGRWGLRHSRLQAIRLPHRPSFSFFFWKYEGVMRWSICPGMLVIQNYKWCLLQISFWKFNRSSSTVTKTSAEATKRL